eukprot:7520678-Pyramimonas_sp.AAC.1
MSGESVSEVALECDHPKWARRRGNNQYAKYEHCLKCKTRLCIERRSPQQVLDCLQRAQERMDRHSDHARAAR